MVWQKGKLEFFEFFAIFLPSLVNWLVPCAIMHFCCAHGTARARIRKWCAPNPALLGRCDPVCADHRHCGQFQELPALATGSRHDARARLSADLVIFPATKRATAGKTATWCWNSFHQIERVEWDTLLFFFGIIFAVGGLGRAGLSGACVRISLHRHWGQPAANVIIGVLSAIVDNIPMMFAVLTMDPAMSARPMAADHPDGGGRRVACCRSARRPAWL